MVTWPEKPPSKYFVATSTTRASTRERSAAPILMFLPETRNDMIELRAARGASLIPRSGVDHASGGRAQGRLFLPPPLHRRCDPHRLTIFCDRSPSDVDSHLAQLFHDSIVRQHVLGILVFNQLPDPVPYR